MKKEISYLQLYAQALYVGLFFVGSGTFFAVTHKRYVDELAWISEEELLDYFAIASALPGGNICNFFTMIGYKMRGVFGAVLMYLGVITAPIAFLTCIAIYYDAFANNRIVQPFLHGMIAATCAIIVDVVIEVSGSTAKSSGWKAFGITAIAFGLNFFLDISLGWIILAGVVASGVTTTVKYIKHKKEGASS